MDTIVADIPNLQPETVPVKNVSISDDAIAAKMAAMRNQTAATLPTETGSSDEAKAEAPVAPKGVEIQEETPENDTNFIEPEVAEPEAEYSEDGIDEGTAPEEVSAQDSTPADVIDFLEIGRAHV
mgnify:CR=1 FL=1